jgi:hypothetical protein
MIHSFTVTFRVKYLTSMVSSVTLYETFSLIKKKRQWSPLTGEFAVVPTDKMCGRSLSSKIPVDMNSIFMKLYVTF